METESVVARLKSCGLFRTQGLIGGKWIDAYDGKTIEVRIKLLHVLACLIIFTKIGLCWLW